MRLTTAIIITLSLFATSWASELPPLEIYFEQGSSSIEPTYMDNESSIDQLTIHLLSLADDPDRSLTHIDISGYSSPEGEAGFNYRLSQSRAEEVERLIKSLIHPSDSVVITRGYGTSEPPQRLDMDAEESLYPSMRVVHITTLFAPRGYAPIASTVTYSTEEFIPLPSMQPVSNSCYRPLFAIKTNLLFDLFMMPSIEVEVPIKRHWSIAGEWMFPWWISFNNRNALQILSTTLEIRYWLDEQDRDSPLRGWFLGVYGGGGDYDLQLNGRGVQGEFYVPVGLSAGYAHPINRRGDLRLEYSLGVGLVKSKYRKYEESACTEFLVLNSSGRHTWFGPTKAKVSLVWLLYRRCHEKN